MQFTNIAARVIHVYDDGMPDPVVNNTPIPAQQPGVQRPHFLSHLTSRTALIWMGLITIFLAAEAGYLYVKNLELSKQIAELRTPAQLVLPTTSPTPDPLPGWQTYATPDISFRYPPDWHMNQQFPTGSGTITVMKDTTDTLVLTVASQGNYNQQTGKPYTSIDDYVGMPYQVQTLMVAGQDARQPLPRAGSETNFMAVFFSEDASKIYRFELDTPRDGSMVNEGNSIFHQILSSVQLVASKVQPTCIPRPPCLDAKPRCLIPETENMCPPSSPTPVQPSGSARTSCALDSDCPSGYRCLQPGPMRADGQGQKYCYGPGEVIPM